MNNIKEAFNHGKAFVAFITCGDPSLEKTEEIVLTLQDAGTDLIELGIPFSDPTAEGDVIMNANLRSLERGTTTDKIFDMVRRLKGRVKVPMVFMTYANVVFSYDADKFIKTCSEIGISGLILPDIPYEEREEFLDICHKYDVALISMIAPTSEQRISMIAKEAEGFLYCVSSLGVTGTRSEITTNVGDMIKLAKAVTDIPCAIGFGISTPEQAKAMASVSDGAIVGSGIVKLCAQYGEDCLPYIHDYVKSMKQAIETL